MLPLTSWAWQKYVDQSKMSEVVPGQWSVVNVWNWCLYAGGVLQALQQSANNLYQHILVFLLLNWRSRSVRGPRDRTWILIPNFESSWPICNKSYPFFGCFSSQAKERKGSDVPNQRCLVQQAGTELFQKKNLGCLRVHRGVSKNRDTPKWMVYNRKPY